MVVMQTLAMGVLRIFVPNIAESSFRTVFAIQWAVGGLVVISFLFVPECVFLKKDPMVAYLDIWTKD